MINFVSDEENTSLGFFENVKSHGLEVEKISWSHFTHNLFNDLIEGEKYFYPIWSGSNNQIDKYKIELINQKKLKLLFVSDGESLQEMTLKSVINFIQQNNIDSKQTVFMSYDLRSEETYKLLLDEYPIFRQYPLKVIGMDTYCFEYSSNYGDLPLPNRKNKKYKYVCYNANAKEYRQFLVTELFRRSLNKKGLISLLYRYGSVEQIYDGFTERLGFDVNVGIGKANKEYAENILSKKIPLVLDKTMEEVDDNDRPVDINHINNSYFNIVTESYMYNSSLPQSHKTIFEMSEKTYKAINCQPFIHLGSYGVLKYMKSMGYETFSELFDESYDDIIDHKDRLISVVESIERACNMDDEKFHNIYCDVIIPKVLHNRSLVNSIEIKEKIWNKFIGELDEL